MRIAASLLVAMLLLIASGYQGSQGGEPAVPATLVKQSKAQSPNFDEMNRVFQEITNTGGTVLCERVSRWSKLRGRSLSEDLSFLRDFSDLACLYVLYCPHHVGLIDAMAPSYLALEDQGILQRAEEALLGCDPGYTVVLRHSPSLLKQLEALRPNPYLMTVTIESKCVDAQLFQAMLKLKVCRLEVGYRDGKCRILYALPSSFPKGGVDEIEKRAEVDVDDAESAMPSLKALPRLKSVHLTKRGATVLQYNLLGKNEAAQVERLRQNIQKALPNVEIITPEGEFELPTIFELILDEFSHSTTGG